MEKLLTTLRVFVGYTILLGVIYPLVILIVGNLLFPHQSQGSLIYQQNRAVGSTLIAQKFTAPKYFHSRFSAIGYEATHSGSSNLAPGSSALMVQTIERLRAVRVANRLASAIKIPADMVLTSASGLDPHISLANAQLQLARVASYRGLKQGEVAELITQALAPNFLGIWGQKGVNVLQLNLLLDQRQR